MANIFKVIKNFKARLPEFSHVPLTATEVVKEDRGHHVTVSSDESEAQSSQLVS